MSARITPARNGHGFGRLKRLPDTRDWHASALLPRLVPKKTAKRTTHEWTVGEPLDQGETPQCTAYAGAKLLYAGPVLNRANVPPPQQIYDLAQQLDEYPDTPPADGSSSRGLMKALQQLGYVTNYAFSIELPVIQQWVLYVSPVCVGSVWLNEMFDPISYKGAAWLHLPQGPVQDADVAGGHEWLIFGCSTTKACPDGSKGAFRMLNSWGPWADDGRAWLSFDDFRTLMLADGDCVMPTELHKPTKAA